MNTELLKRNLKIVFSNKFGFPLYAPDSVSLIVSKRCNLKCRMCDFWKDNKRDGANITLDAYEELFKDLRLFGTRAVQLTGGEPFLRKDLNDILKRARKNQLETIVVTNGTLINKDNVNDFAANTNLVYISLDAPSGRQHEYVRGVPGIFKRIMESVKLLTSCIKKNACNTRVVLCATITPQSIHDPSMMADLAREMGVNGIIYNPASTVDYGYTTLRNTFLDEQAARSYSEMIDKIIHLMQDSKNLIRSNPFYLSASKEFLKGNKRFYEFSCVGGGYNGPLIASDGAVFPCCAWNVPLGNIKEKPFSEIWKSDEAKEARRKIKKGRCPVCYHHTRTFDYLLHAPRLFKNPARLLEGYKGLLRR